MRPIFFKLWLAVLLLILAGALLPGSAVTALARYVPRFPVHLTDKHLHFCEYAVLAALSLGAFHRTRNALLSAAAAVLLGVALEFVQRLIPGRGFEPADMLANSWGVLSGLLLASLARATRMSHA